MPALKPGWYVLNYHDVSWESSILSRGIGGTVTPDVFAQHLSNLTRLGELISIQDGLHRCRRDIRFERPAFSLWFDDGYVGVRKYAFPICRRFGVSAALSVCSRFVSRQEMFWRAMMSYLVFVDAIRILRSRCRALGYTADVPLKRWTMANFSEQFLEILKGLYDEQTTSEFRADAFRIFDDLAGLRTLAAEGWVIANHSAAHYPLTPRNGRDFALQQFEECASLVRGVYDEHRFWVVPFEYRTQAGSHEESFLRTFSREATVVRVQDRLNTGESLRSSEMVYRFATPWGRRGASPLSLR